MVELPVSGRRIGQGSVPVSNVRATGRFAHVYAALDLGTNNCRLLVARPTADGFRVIDAFSRIVRLGEGVAQSGRLSAEAMDRAAEALGICAEKMRRRGVDRTRAVATEACRRAANGAAFLARVRAETGISLDVVSAAEEARLALAGCAPLLDPGSRRALVFDIGGGSTELMWLRIGRDGGFAMDAWVSLPTGVVTLAERWGGAEASPEAFAGMLSEVTALLQPFEAEHGLARHIAEGGVQFLGTSGTVTTLAGVHFDLPRYERSRVDGAWIDFREVHAISRRLATMTWAERARHPCIGAERADLVVAGCAILAAIHHLWPAERLRVADRGVREGVLLDLIRSADAEAATASLPRPA